MLEIMPVKPVRNPVVHNRMQAWIEHQNFKPVARSGIPFQYGLDIISQIIKQDKHHPKKMHPAEAYLLGNKIQTLSNPIKKLHNSASKIQVIQNYSHGNTILIIYSKPRAVNTNPRLFAQVFCTAIPLYANSTSISLRNQQMILIFSRFSGIM